MQIEHESPKPESAHHESPEIDARRSIVRTLNRDPYDVWTRESLASAIGQSPGLTGRVLAELVGAGVVRRLPGPDEEYSAAGGGY